MEQPLPLAIVSLFPIERARIDLGIRVVRVDREGSSEPLFGLASKLPLPRRQKYIFA